MFTEPAKIDELRRIRVLATLQAVSTAVNSPAPGRMVFSALPHSEEMARIASSGTATLEIFSALASTGWFSPTPKESSSSNLVLRSKDEYVKAWQDLDTLMGYQEYKVHTEVTSSPVTPKPGTLTGDQVALLARIRRFRNKFGRLQKSVVELVKEVREENG